MNRDVISFVGPVTVETSIVGGSRVQSAHFLMMSAGSDPLKLEYPNKRVARDARNQLIKAPRTFGVPTTKLLQAIHEAIQHVGITAPKADDYELTLEAIVSMETEWDNSMDELLGDEQWKLGYSEALGEAASKAKVTLAKWNADPDPVGRIS